MNRTNETLDWSNHHKLQPCSHEETVDTATHQARKSEQELLDMLAKLQTVLNLPYNERATALREFSNRDIEVAIDTHLSDLGYIDFVQRNPSTANMGTSEFIYFMERRGCK